jgi:hypothetical protein
MNVLSRAFSKVRFSHFANLSLHLAAGLIAASVLLPATAAARDGEEPTVMVIVEETIESPEREANYFWWQNPQDPTWSETDESLRAAMESYGLQWASTKGVNVSRIYQSRQLSRSRATAFASVVGADFVVKGDVDFAFGKRRVFGLGELEAGANVELFSADKRDEFSRSFEIRRRRFASEPRQLLEPVRKEIATAIAAQVEGFLEQHEMPIGVELDEPLIGLEETGKAVNFRKVRAFLSGLKDVDSAVVNWAAEGVIALELNPDGEDGRQLYQRAVEKLLSNRFSDFRLEEIQGPTYKTFRVVGTD